MLSVSRYSKCLQICWKYSCFLNHHKHCHGHCHACLENLHFQQCCKPCLEALCSLKICCLTFLSLHFGTQFFQGGRNWLMKHCFVLTKMMLILTTELVKKYLNTTKPLSYVDSFSSSMCFLVMPWAFAKHMPPIFSSVVLECIEFLVWFYTHLNTII